MKIKNTRDERGQRNVFEIEREVTNDFSVLESEGLKVEIKSESGGPPTGKAVWIKLIANNSSKLLDLKKVAEDFESHLRSIEGAKNVGLSSTDNPGQFVYRFDNDKISFVWLTPDDIIREVSFLHCLIKIREYKVRIWR